MNVEVKCKQTRNIKNTPYKEDWVCMGPSVGSQSDICDVNQLSGRNIMFSVIPLLYHLGLIDEVNSKRFPYSG